MNSSNERPDVMTSRQRVMAVLNSETPDRVPLNVFAGWNPGVRERVEKRYGSIDAFYEEFHIDIITGVLPRFTFGGPEEHARIADLDRYLELDPVDPTAPDILQANGEEELFLTVEEALEYQEQDYPVFAHVWGIFELSQFLFEKDGRPGTQEALMNMIAEREKSKQIYMKLAEWTAACAENAIQAGVDVLQVSDDWGQQKTMLFSPEMWREMIRPAFQVILDTAHRYNVPVILHSDGDITAILDDLADMGLQGLHPVQESAGMSHEVVRKKLGRDVCIMGGLDTVSAMPVMSPSEIREEVRNVFNRLKSSGPFIFAGTHMFQDDASLEVIAAAYEEAYAQSHTPVRGDSV